MDEFVFETVVSDIPPLSVPLPSYVKTDDIDVSVVNARDAFEVFMGKKYTASSRGDISTDSVLNAAATSSGLYDSKLDRPRSSMEGPLARFRRIQAEISSFHTQLSLLAKDAESKAVIPADGPTTQQTTLTELMLHVSILRQQLDLMSATSPALMHDPATTTARAPAVEDHVEVDGGYKTGEATLEQLQSAVKNTLKSTKSTVSTALASPKAGIPPASTISPGLAGKDLAPSVVYEVYEMPSALEKSPKLLNFESRIAALETAIGTSAYAAPTSSTGVELNYSSRLHALERKVEVLKNPAMLSAELSVLTNEMQRLAALNATKSQQRVIGSMVSASSATSTVEGYDVSVMSSVTADKLLQLALESQSISQRLPAIVNRMKKLQSLHEEGCKFSQRLAHLEDVRERNAVIVAGDREVLREMRESWAGNLTTIIKNMAALEKKCDAILKN